MPLLSPRTHKGLHVHLMDGRRVERRVERHPSTVRAATTDSWRRVAISVRKSERRPRTSVAKVDESEFAVVPKLSAIAVVKLEEVTLIAALKLATSASSIA